MVVPLRCCVGVWGVHMIFDSHRLHRQAHEDDDVDSNFMPLVVGTMLVILVWALLYALLS